MARLDKTIKDYQEQLKNKGIKDIPDFIQSILNSDITNGKYSRFLLDCYLNDKFREEDLKGGLDSTIGEAIILFHKHKNKLPEEMRSVYQYNSPGSLWNAVKQFDGELSGKELKKELQDKIYAETEFLYEDEVTGFKIISPLSEDAAKWWGKGTRWCTAAEKNNQFKNYAKKAPLLILLMPGGEKLQLWKSELSIQFMDEADNKIRIDYIEKNWSILEPVFRWLKDLRYIPDKYKDYTMCLDAIKQNGRALLSVPDQYRDYNLCMEAVKRCGDSLINVPEYLKDYNLCLEAVNQDGPSLNYTPEEHKDYTMCLEAVNQNGYALRYIPNKNKDYNLCLKAVKQNGEALIFVPNTFWKKYIDYTMCLEAIKKKGKVLQFVPQKLVDYNLCLEAVKQYGEALLYVPEQLGDYNLCLEAVKQNGKSLLYVPEELKDYKLCLEAVKQNGKSLFYVPEKLRDYNLYLESVKQNGHVLSYVPKGLINYNMCLEAVKQNGYALRSVPEELLNYNLCLEAVKQDKLALNVAPEEYQEKLQSYLDEIIIIIPEDKYQQTFTEIRSYFPEKELSLII